MKDALAVFLREFAVPYVQREGCTIRRVVPFYEVPTWNVQIDKHSDLVRQIDSGRSALASEMVCSPVGMSPDIDLSLLVSIYNSLLLVHPHRYGLSFQRGKVQRDVRTTLIAARPDTAEAALWNYTLVQPLIGATREDTFLQWWTGKAEYYGTVPPRRLQRWQAMRQVTQKVRVTRFEDMFASDDYVGICEGLSIASPLSALLCASPCLPLDWQNCLQVLREKKLARSVLYGLIASKDYKKIIRKYTRSYRRLWEEAADIQSIHTVASFFAYIQYHLCFIDALPRWEDSDRASVVANAHFWLVPELQPSLAPLASVASKVSGLDDAQAASSMAVRWQQFRRRLIGLVGESVVRDMRENWRQRCG